MTPKPSLVAKEAVVNKLRELGFTHKRQAPRVDFWKMRGDTRRVTVPRQSQLSIETATLILHHAGCSPKEISEFLRAAMA